MDNGGAGYASDPLVYSRIYRVTDSCGNYTEQTQTFTVTDNTAPTITFCPPNLGPVNADAGSCTASLFWQVATATDNCAMHPTEPITYWIGSTQISSPHAFDSGLTTVTVKAKDACGNINATCSFTVTVNAFNDLLVTVELSPSINTGGAFPQTLTRCITFEQWDCDPPTGPVTVTKEVVFNVTNAGGSPPPPNVAIGTASLTNVPCGAAYECITARDTLHTLRRTDEGSTISGTQ